MESYRAPARVRRPRIVREAPEKPYRGGTSYRKSPPVAVAEAGHNVAPASVVQKPEGVTITVVLVRPRAGCSKKGPAMDIPHVKCIVAFAYFCAVYAVEVQVFNMH